MKILKILLVIVFITILGIVAGWFGPWGGKRAVDTPEERNEIWDGKDAVKKIKAVEKENLIVLESPRPSTTISSPVILTGKARGNWYFEASFPVSVVDWDGQIIGQGHAETQPDPVTGEVNWMTTEFVPFKATITFDISKVKKGYPDRMSRGSLILHKDNPSGLSENDDALEIPVLLK